MIKLFSEHYVIQTMTRDLVSREWRRWAADGALMRTINSSRMDVSLTELRGYVATFDNKLIHLLGVFDKSSSKHLGIYEMDVHPTHRTAEIQVLIGSGPVARVRAEADTTLFDYLFGQGGIEKVVAKVPVFEERQARHLEKMGFRKEGLLREERRVPGTGERTDYVQYGLLEEDWE